MEGFLPCLPTCRYFQPCRVPGCPNKQVWKDYLSRLPTFGLFGRISSPKWQDIRGGPSCLPTCRLSRPCCIKGCIFTAQIQVDNRTGRYVMGITDRTSMGLGKDDAGHGKTRRG
ncbi:hypothetical protein J5N97_010680 [Dioscorea zingiberensis]|uniref:Uncharacterized protein n=1 Tax=Dioscorea zingiberensis TaxID=325984 RepID=A0A9D5HMM4_9LILI|nr:hypothetical protein J5N97_010680 [Dioscorea zingiberensis]